MTKHISGWLDVSGAELEYCMIAPASDQASPLEQSPTIVLLHEGLGCVAMWRDFPSNLAAHTGCGVFVYSRRGYGKSSAYPPPWPLEYMHNEASVLAEVLKQLDIKKALLCGHSDGASIAALCQGNSAPSNVCGLILMAPHFFAEQIALDAIRQTVSGYHHGNLRERLKTYHGSNVDNAFLGWSGAWLRDDFAQWNIESVLPAIEIPILVLQGKQDQYGTIAQVETVRQHGGEVLVAMFDDCKHAPHSELPELTLHHIGRFIRTCLAD